MNCEYYNIFDHKNWFHKNWFEYVLSNIVWFGVYFAFLSLILAISWNIQILNFIEIVDILQLRNLLLDQIYHGVFVLFVSFGITIEIVSDFMILRYIDQHLIESFVLKD